MAALIVVMPLGRGAPVPGAVSPATATLSAGQALQFSTTLKGNVVWAISPPAGTISRDGLYTAPPSITLQQSVSIVAISSNGSISNAQVTLSPGSTGGSISVTPGTATLTASQAQQFTATVTGLFGTGASVIWTLSPPVGAISSTGYYTAPASLTGTQNVTVTATSTANSSVSGSAVITLNGTTPSVSVQPTVTSVATGKSAQYNASGGSGQGFKWNVNGIPGGNSQVGTITSQGLYTAPATPPSPATATITAVDNGPTSASGQASALIVQNIGVTVSPTTTSVQISTSKQFTATVTGTTNTGVIWSVNGVSGGNSSVGLVTSAGVYTAPGTVPAGGSVTVTAASAADTSVIGNASVTVTSTGSGSVSVSPASTTVQTSTTKQFSATVTGLSSTLVNWSVNGLPGGSATVGTITSGGLYSAPLTVPAGGNVTVTATSTADATVSGNSTVTVTSTSSGSVTVSPANTTVQTSTTKQFSATVTGLSSTLVNWSVNGLPGGSAAVGTITSGGLYSAPLTVPAGGNVAVTATSAVNPIVQGTATATITSGSAGLAITTSTLPNGNTGVAYNASVVASGGTTPYSWSIQSGQLPPGLGLGTTTGTISGTPTAGGSYNVVVRVTDAAGIIVSASFAFAVAASLTITTASIPSPTPGTPYSVALTAAGGTTPYFWTLASGQLPAGLNMNSAGNISGTPSTSGSFAFTVQVTDAANGSATQQYAGTVSSGGAGGGTFNITNADLPNGTLGTAYNVALGASGGTPPYVWTVTSGALPAGIALNSSTGALTGTPTKPGWSGLIGIQANDAAGSSTSLQYSFAVMPAFDQYGGMVGQTCTTTGYFHTQKIGNRWWLCTPAGNITWMTSLGGAFAPDNGCDPKTGLCNSYQTIAKQKYGDLDVHWGPQQNRRLQLWGFNSVGQLSSGWMYPTQTCPGCAGWPGGEHPVKMPVTQTILVSNYAAINLWNYASHPVKNMMFGLNQNYTGWRASIMDFYDPAFGQFVDNMVANDNGVKTFLASPWTIGLFLDDTDWFWGMGAGPDFHTQPMGHTNAHPGFMTLVTASSQTFNPDPSSRGVAQLYTDSKIYSKVGTGTAPTTCAITSPCSLRDYLYRKYSGSISALNQSWGSNYTSFDSTGTQVNGELVGVGDGATTSFSKKLANGSITPQSVLISVGGIPQAGDCPWWNSPCNITGPNQGSFAGPAGTAIVSGSLPWLSAYEWQSCSNCSLPAASYWVKITYHMKPGYFSQASREVGDTSSIPNRQIVVKPPAPDPNATGWDVYVSCTNQTSPGVPWCSPQGQWNTNELLQASNIPFDQSWVEPTNGLVSGASVPTPLSFIDYVNGTMTVKFSQPPASGQQIAVNYITNGWMFGTGLMDEDGRNKAWVGTNAYCLTPATACDGKDAPLPNANANLGADLDAWVAQFAGQYFSSVRNGLKKHAPNVMYLGADTVGTWGVPPRKEILAGAAPYIDILFTQWFAGLPDTATSDQINQYVSRYFGDKPMMNFMTLQANTDSTVYQYANDGVSIGGTATQPDRAQLYSNMITAMLTKPSYNGSYQWVGMNWWGLTDYWNEKYNWGLVSLTDNPYDGKSSTTVSRKDPFGYTSTPETRNFGNGTDLIKYGNSRWWSQLSNGTLP